MKRLCLLVAFFALNVFTAHSNEYAEAFLMYDDTVKVDLFDTSDGKIISVIVNEVDEEFYVLFDLIDKNDTMYYVRLASDNYPERIGWIKRTTPLYIYSSNYSVDFYLYSLPNNQSKVVYSQQEWLNMELRVLDFYGKWLKVIIAVDGITYTGWLSPDMQCSNIYTTCN